MAAHAPATPAMRRRPGRRLLALLRESLLTLAAIGGVACIAMVILAFTGGYSLIMFKTGSMSPTIPAGSVALVQEIAASEVEVGDVLTVDRPSMLPVTHRVTDVKPGPTAEQRTITMKGDANNTEDPAPYVIAEGRIVRGSVPHLAHVIVWFGNPWVLGGITVAAATLVTWAFWPREERREDTTSRARIPTAAVVALLTGATVLGPSTEPAAAAGPLIMHSDLSPAATYPLSATTPLFWHIDIDAQNAPSNSELRVAISSIGDRELGMRAEIRSCTTEWLGTTCRTGERLLRQVSEPSLDGSWSELLRQQTPTSTHLRIALTAEPAESATGDEYARVRVRATAGGTFEETSIGGEGELETTGSGQPGLLLAPIAVFAGLAIAWASTLR